jgi:hypothetical protein
MYLGMDRFHGVKVRDRFFFYQSTESNGTSEVLIFYFTNIPEDIVHEDLRRGFLTIGVLLVVYLSKRRNELGKRFFFVRFWHV